MPRRRPAARSPSPGRATRPARAGASTPRGAACGSTSRCAGSARFLHPFAATRSTPTARSRPRSSSTTARSGRTCHAEAKSKVAETLDEFRGDFAYNLLDENKRRFNAEVPLLVQWDDHETLNNWYPGEIIGDDALQGQERLAAGGLCPRRRCSNSTRCGLSPDDAERIYRHFGYGPAARRLHARRAQLPRPELAEPPGRAGPTRRRSSARAAAWLKRALLRLDARPGR